MRLKEKKKILFVLICSLGLLVFQTALSATGASPGTIRLPNPLAYDTLEEFIDALISFIFWVAFALAPLMIIIGAFYLLTSAGNEKRVTTGKNIILYTIIGFVIILFARGLVAVIKTVLGL